MEAQQRMSSRPPTPSAPPQGAMPGAVIGSRPPPSLHFGDEHATLARGPKPPLPPPRGSTPPGQSRAPTGAQTTAGRDVRPPALRAIGGGATPDGGGAQFEAADDAPTLSEKQFENLWRSSAG